MIATSSYAFHIGGCIKAPSKCHEPDEERLQNKLKCKVDTPIHGSIREWVTWECKEHGVNIMNVLPNPKGSVGRWNRNFWRLSRAILHKFLKQGCCRHLF